VSIPIFRSGARDVLVEFHPPNNGIPFCVGWGGSGNSKMRPIIVWKSAAHTASIIPGTLRQIRAAHAQQENGQQFQVVAKLSQLVPAHVKTTFTLTDETDSFHAIFFVTETNRGAFVQ
jgi:hypothetical protein